MRAARVGEWCQCSSPALAEHAISESTVTGRLRARCCRWSHAVALAARGNTVMVSKFVLEHRDKRKPESEQPVSFNLN